MSTPTRTERTRARILAAALELFSRNGYAATTVEDIAAAAGVTPMTFYRHFGTKDQVLIDDPYDPLIVEEIARQRLDLPPLQRTVRGVREAWRRLPITEEAPVRERVAIAAVTPSLLPALRASTTATESAIAEQLALDGTDPTDAAVAAAAVMAALMTGLTRWAMSADGTAISDAIERSLDVMEAADD